ncbi:CHRD domain-containing protein [Litoribacter ruber]|uniref:CHRD domain-containing protein n=1 Tax=Litoribacter ruber TaxID=702568 RepID=UPI001BD96476|nr:CHRD domain-containing protein [Litoribacter ruber]MBT0809772.1 CHRD domain-containing protein [Litoribacter ruber]
MKPIVLLFCLAMIACSTKEVQSVDEEVLTFSVMMVQENVATTSMGEITPASGGAKLTLLGNELTVTGEFEDLNIQMQDASERPQTPVVHIHPGLPGEENEYLYELEVKLHDEGNSGTFYGTFELSDDEVALLADGRLYMDLHTHPQGPSTIRDQIQIYEPQDFETFLTSAMVYKP